MGNKLTKGIKSIGKKVLNKKADVKTKSKEGQMDTIRITVMKDGRLVMLLNLPIDDIKDMKINKEKMVISTKNNTALRSLDLTDSDLIIEALDYVKKEKSQAEKVVEEFKNIKESN